MADQCKWCAKTSLCTCVCMRVWVCVCVCAYRSKFNQQDWMFWSVDLHQQSIYFSFASQMNSCHRLAHWWTFSWTVVMSLSVNGAVQIWWILYVKLWNRRERFMLGLKLNLGHQWDRRKYPYYIVRCPYFRGWVACKNCSLGKDKVSLLERCPYFMKNCSWGKKRCPYSSFQGVSERLVLN